MLFMFNKFTAKPDFAALIFVAKPKNQWRHLFPNPFLIVHVLFAKAISQNYPNDNHVYHTNI